jgi:PAS domain S-box-containing protein
MEGKVRSEISILFVDDEKLIRNAFTRDLRAEGFTVTPAASGSEAISALKGGAYNLVITDLMMPDVDGFAVLKAVKSNTPTTGVIILTGYGDMQSAIDALRLGADDFTLKPCEVDELVLRIQRCLDKQNLLQMLALRNQELDEEIRQRRLVETQLRESDTRFRQALDAASNGVWERNLRTGEVYYGENWYHTLGYEENKAFSGEYFFENLLHPDDRERVLAQRTAHVLGETSRYEVEYRVRNKTGGWQWMLSRGKAIARDEQGKALRIIGTITDITRLKEFEAALEQRVHERTVELSEANIALTVLLKKREEDRNQLAEQVFANATKLVEPFFDRLYETRLTEQQQVLADILRANIRELTSPFASKYSTKMTRLTPMEIQIANLVKQGKRSKEIAEILQLSPGTIDVHRKNIRKKLDIAHLKTNLQTVLSLNTE